MNIRTRARCALLTASALGFGGLGVATPALAQAAAGNGDNDIIVTAQRVEQRLQDVPISITVLSSEKLSNNNITSAKDIATYTPGLTTNNRYGSDNTTWTIRGFTQEQRTTSTVGTYFGDVVAPRGSGATQGGDGAGPGNLFDLQNVQVLKGPQGTLFGRNSTGGAVLLVPKKPTSKSEGYFEGSVGDYGMWRTQSVINVPIDDALRVRFGMDHMSRDGFQKNAGKIGFGPWGDAGGSVNYTAFRLSAVMDLAPDLENYIIGSYSSSRSTGVMPKINQCFTANPYTGAAIGAAATATTQASGGFAACAQMQREAALGFWSVSNTVPDAQSRTKQWQIIDTMTWRASDSLTIKNIVSYAQFRGTTNLDLFGWYRPLVTPGTETNGMQVQSFNTTHAIPGGYTNAESSLVEELQVQYHSSDNKLQAQGGLYYESNSPLGESGIQSTTQTPCQDIAGRSCVPGQNGSSLGRLAYQTTFTKFRGKAAYFQASYEVNDKLKLTGGIRYTEDTMDSRFRLEAIRLFAPGSLGIGTVPTIGSTVNGVSYPDGAFWCLNDIQFGKAGTATNPYQPLSNLRTGCLEHHKVKTSAPTWLLDVDYKPMEDMLLYAKWSRGYRQGGIAAFAADQLQDYKQERVDTFEVGAKTSWHGAMPGWFNVSAFYNNFRDQQLQIGLQCAPVSACAQTTAIINAGKSSLKGFEVETGITPFKGLRLDASYAYLKTTIKAITDPTALIASKGLPFNDIRPLPIGSEIPNSMPHKLTISANYTLPIPEGMGKLSFGGTWIYQSKYRAVSDPFLLTAVSPTATPVIPYQYGSEYGVLPGNKMLNLNLNWENLAGLPVDAGVFVTNVTNAKVLLHANVQATSGFVSNIIGEPRMFGARMRIKY